MGFKKRWQPNASQRREFAERMKDEDEKAAYEARKRAKNTYSDNPLSFKHKDFVPTEFQYQQAQKFLNEQLTPTQKYACNRVCDGFVCQDKVSHDYIHIINSLQRGTIKPGNDLDLMN